MKHRMVLAVLLLVFAAVNALPRVAWAQETALSGSVTDSTGAVLPGVTVTATHVDSGNTFLAVTDGRGEFRLALRTGSFRIMTELPGFATAVSTLELLVGQESVLNIQMKPSTVQESVTVTGDAPLVDVTQSSISSNIDPRQLQQLPVNGRNWQDLALLLPGNRANAVSGTPVARLTGGTYQLNVDGQQVTNMVVITTTHGNPKYSRDSIAEFEFIANRFDATQGRSAGVQVNAVTKSGTNTPTGTFAAYFRDDRFNAPNPVVGRVLPYSNTQASATFGGPIRRDRIHFFGNYEYEREPQTVAYATPYPRFNLDVAGTRREHTGGARFDVQFSPKTRVNVRANKWTMLEPFGGGNGALTNFTTTTPASLLRTRRNMGQVLGTLTHVLNDRTVNDMRVGYATYGWDVTSVVKYGNTPTGTGYGSPQIRLRGLTIGQGDFIPDVAQQDTYSIRDDLTYSYTRLGRHDLKLGAEYLRYSVFNYFCNQCVGILDASIAPRPASLEDLFPNILDANTWNLAALSPITIRWRQGFGDFDFSVPRYVFATWAQDDWKITPRLSLNLGVRYDLQAHAFANDVAILPFLPANRPDDTNNIAPRLGSVFTIDDRTVLRGGFGIYFGETQNAHFTKAWSQQFVPEVPNDGRPDFASNPFNGPVPAYAQLLATACDTTGVRPGCVRREVVPSGLPNPNFRLSYSYQASLGAQRQLGNSTAVSVDYLFNGGRDERVIRNINLNYNPTTGANYPYADIPRRPYPDWGAVLLWFPEGRSNMHALETSFTKRLSNRWQASANYMFSGLWDSTSPPLTAFPLVPDLGGEYTLAASDQRHRLVSNAIWELGRGFQLSGLYFFGSGERFSTNWGPDIRDVGAAGEGRLRPDGTIVARNALVGKPIHRVDLRLQETLPLTRRTKIDAILEVFNALNHSNYGSYTTQESNPAYGRPSLNLNVAYVPRSLQLGFRLSF